LKHTKAKADFVQHFNMPESQPVMLNTTRRIVTIVGAAFLVGLVIRTLLLDSKSLWLDEALSIKLAADPNLLWGAGFDNAHPPLYYTLLHYWLPLGESEFTLRLSSALVGSLAIPLSYALAVRLADQKVALTTIWLTALAPLLVWYAQELRSYSLFMVLGLLASLAFVNLLSRPTLWWWLLFVLAISAAGYTHYAAFVLIAAQIGIAGILYLQQRTTRKGFLLWLLAWPAVGLLYWPWLTTPGMRAFVTMITSNGFYPLRLAALQFSPALILAGVAIVLMVFVGLAFGFRMLRKSNIAWSHLAATSFVRYAALVFFITLTIISVVPRAYTVKKLVIALWPYGLLAPAWIFPWKLPNRIPLLLVFTLSFVASLVNITVIPKDQWRELAAYMLTHSEPTDSIWIEPRYQMVALSYYLTHPEYANVEGSSAKINLGKVAPAMSKAELDANVGKGQRVWMIYHTVNFTVSDPERRLEKWLVAKMKPVTQLHFYRIEATLYAPR
jgi:uncharacterized membrane protein